MRRRLLRFGHGLVSLCGVRCGKLLLKDWGFGLRVLRRRLLRGGDNFNGVHGLHRGQSGFLHWLNRQRLH